MVYIITPIPSSFKHQTIGLRDFKSVAELPPADVVAYFRAHPDAARRVLGQSYDKRYTPSTFIEETDGGYCVGWFHHEREQVQRFTDFSEAAADYILFSFGRGRLSC